MSLIELQTFIRKLSRILYFNSCPNENKERPADGSRGRDADMDNENRMKDPTAHIIPLCIDYIIEFDFCEAKTLAECL